MLALISLNPMIKLHAMLWFSIHEYLRNMKTILIKRWLVFDKNHKMYNLSEPFCVGKISSGIYFFPTSVGFF